MADWYIALMEIHSCICLKGGCDGSPADKSPGRQKPQPTKASNDKSPMHSSS